MEPWLVENAFFNHIHLSARIKGIFKIHSCKQLPHPLYRVNQQRRFFQSTSSLHNHLLDVFNLLSDLAITLHFLFYIRNGVDDGGVIAVPEALPYRA